jgi:RibD domain-containing protein
VRTLIEHDLVDELRLMVYPVVLGVGERLFGETRDKTPTRLFDTKTIGDGLAYPTYEIIRDGLAAVGQRRRYETPGCHAPNGRASGTPPRRQKGNMGMARSAARYPSQQRSRTRRTPRLSPQIRHKRARFASQRPGPTGAWER